MTMKAFDTKEHGKSSTSSSERPSGKGDMRTAVDHLRDNQTEKAEPLKRGEKG